MLQPEPAVGLPSPSPQLIRAKHPLASVASPHFTSAGISNLRHASSEVEIAIGEVRRTLVLRVGAEWCLGRCGFRIHFRIVTQLTKTEKDNTTWWRNVASRYNEIKDT